MTETEKKIQELETMFDMTAHPGWNLLLEDIEGRIEALKDGSVRGEVPPYQNGLIVGRHSTLREFLGLRGLLELALEQEKPQDE